jgi:ribosomal-protein-alanine N-acetyltransferase
LNRFHIRLAKSTDLHEINIIEDDSFPAPYPPALLERLLQQYPDTFLVAADGSRKLAGYCVFALEGKLVHLISIAVLPGHRRNGVGSALLQNLIMFSKRHDVKELWLEVNLGNKEAIRLYEKFGFARAMILENYYSDGSAALRMRLSLDMQGLRVAGYGR